MNYKEMFFLISRYFALMLLASFNLWVFYSVFTPLTIYPVHFILSLIYPSAILVIEKSSIVIGKNAIELISACIAGAAYYLLFILNFTTPMSLKTRLKSLIFLIVSFWLLNIMRITVFSLLFFGGYDSYFDMAHKLVWYFGSTVFVVLLWFANVKLFNLFSIPVYSDIKCILDDAFPKNNGNKKEGFVIK
jgi:exosortase/archaeosortase family protein